MSQTINLEISQGSRTLTLSQEEIRVIEAVSPTVDAERTEDGVQITVHDLHGTETVNLYDGTDGVGISGAVLNADYTLTLTFTDGSSYTTPSIRGAQGQPGQTGATPDISIGTVETLTPGSPVTVTITGTAENPVLSFGIPQGQQGTPGRDGVDGAPGRDGVDGQDGAPGKSAYQAAVEAGFTGTEAEFNEYLSGIGDLTEDVSQQKSAINAQFEEIETVTLTEDTSAFIRTETPGGRAYDFSAMIIKVTLPARRTDNITVFFRPYLVAGVPYQYSNMVRPSGYSYDTLLLFAEINGGRIFEDCEFGLAANPVPGVLKDVLRLGVNPGVTLNHIRLWSFTFPAGTTIAILGKWKV